jgi:hypothetical protein
MQSRCLDAGARAKWCEWLVKRSKFVQNSLAAASKEFQYTVIASIL